jgi:hypothetical protein
MNDFLWFIVFIVLCFAVYGAMVALVSEIKLIVAQRRFNKALKKGDISIFVFEFEDEEEEI